MFKIGDFSKLAQVSIKTLRYYGEIGLIKPAWIDRYTGYRYYTVEQLPRLNRIVALKDLGFSLEQVKLILQEDLSAEQLRGMMRMKQVELEHHIQEEQSRLDRVEARLRQILREGALPTYDVVLKRIPTLQVFGIRQVVSSKQHLPNLFTKLNRCLDEQNLVLRPGCAPLAIYYDTEYEEKNLDVEAAAPISQPSHKSSRALTHELPGVEQMACVIHQGELQEISNAYNALLIWIETNGYRVIGHNREVYLHRTASETEPVSQVTEVQVPAKKKPTVYFFSKTQEKDEMEPKIVTKPSFTVVGMMYHGKNENNEISQLWGQFNPRMGEIKNVTDGAFGLCAPPDDSGAFDYMAGFAVSNTDEVPQGMQIWEVPKQKYAVFPCTLKTIGDTYKHAFETWIPGSGVEYTQGTDFEYYDENFKPDVDDSILYIHIPIT
jgi:predicted transcriptional regulator YdeE